MCLAIPGKILELLPDLPLALVDVGGVRRKVDLALLADENPRPGDWVLIHVGFALSKISEQDALEQIRTLEMLGEQQAAMDEVRGYGLGEEPGGGNQEAGEGSQKPGRIDPLRH
ncbi:MAG TPA: HypC/HybG/HupF family hydrogenase formation chaperone [Terriglobia bacterium]|nr:HypC/HybG/HupF family hydrogenase formation chaperone [Terriglobia bacterium]